jgi:hypothetical protein
MTPACLAFTSHGILRPYLLIAIRIWKKAFLVGPHELDEYLNRISGSLCWGPWHKVQLLWKNHFWSSPGPTRKDIPLISMSIERCLCALSFKKIWANRKKIKPKRTSGNCYVGQKNIFCVWSQNLKKGASKIISVKYSDSSHFNIEWR